MMPNEYTIRLLTMDDAPQAAALWSLVFGDDEATVLEFFRLFGHQQGFGACAEAEGKIVAAAYSPAGTDYITPDGTSYSGAYLYAVATHPNFRKHGLARKVCSLLKETAWAQGRQYLFTRPSEDSLYDWYEEKIGAVPLLGGEKRSFSLTEEAALPCRRLLTEEYAQLRSRYLKGLPHVRQSSRWLSWESVLHESYGGGFYAVGGHIADVYADTSTKTLYVNELLPHPTHEQAQQICSALMTLTGTDRCECMLHGSGRYVSVAANECPMPEANPWFGPCYG